jgi:hypothetical protein
MYVFCPAAFGDFTRPERGNGDFAELAVLGNRKSPALRKGTHPVEGFLIEGYWRSILAATSSGSHKRRKLDGYGGIIHYRFIGACIVADANFKRNERFP